MAPTILVKVRLIKKYMGILSKRNSQKKNEIIISQQMEDRIIKANLLFASKNYSECAKAYREILNEFGDLTYVLPESYEIIKKMIKVSYEMGTKDEAYKYIALLALTERSKANMNDFVFTVAKISFDANDLDFARGFIKASYYSSDGAYFYSSESKKYLQFVGIEDNRTFDDYCQDY